MWFVIALLCIWIAILAFALSDARTEIRSLHAEAINLKIAATEHGRRLAAHDKQISIEAEQWIKATDTELAAVALAFARPNK